MNGDTEETWQERLLAKLDAMESGQKFYVIGSDEKAARALAILRKRDDFRELLKNGDADRFVKL